MKRLTVWLLVVVVVATAVLVACSPSERVYETYEGTVVGTRKVHRGFGGGVGAVTIYLQSGERLFFLDDIDVMIGASYRFKVYEQSDGILVLSSLASLDLDTE